MTASPAPARRIPIRIVVAAVVLGLVAVSRLLEIPAALAGLMGPTGTPLDGPAVLAMVFLGLWLALPAALAVLATVLLVTRRFAAIVPLMLLLLYTVAVTVSSLVRRYVEPLLIAEVVAVAVALVLVLTPPARTWLRSRPAPPAPR